MTAATVEAPPERRRASGTIVKLLLSISLLAVAAGMMTITSLALFTDSETVTGNTFSTGTVDIAATPVTAVVTAAAMAPGDQVTAPLAVDNNGTLDLRYAITSTTTENVLAAELVLTIKTSVTSCTDALWTADGTVIYSGVLGTTGTSAIVGSNAAGADPGDRTLTAGSSETLCVNVTLPLAATAGQGITSTATFTFDAEQTSNNP